MFQTTDQEEMTSEMLGDVRAIWREQRSLKLVQPC